MINAIPHIQPDNRENRSQPDDANARLIRDLQAAARQSTNEDGLLHNSVRVLADCFGTPGVRIWSLAGDADRLRLRAAAGLDLPFEALQDNVPVDGSEPGRVIRDGEIYVADCRSESAPDDVRTWAARAGVAMFVAAPLVVEGRTWGVLAMFSAAGRTVPPPELLSAVTDTLGQALARFESGRGGRAPADLLSSLMPCLPQAIVALDREGLITHWNRSAESLFGWGRDEVIGKPLPIFPTERRREDGSLDDIAACPARVASSQTVCQRADQSRVHVQRTTAPLFDACSEIIGRVEVLADDSRRVLMSRCLHVQARVARILAGSRGVDDAVAPLLTALGEWLGCDTAEFWGLDARRGELTRSGAWARTPEFRDRLAATAVRVKSDSSDWPARACRAQAVASNLSLDGPEVAAVFPSHSALRVPVPGLAIPIRRNDERLGVVTCVGHAFTDPDGFVTQTLEFMGDALAQFLTRVRTEAALAEAQANARQAQKMDAIGLLAGGVAHDFNNVLTVILAYSELGLDESGTDDARHEMFAEIHGAGERAAAMTRQLLAVSRQQEARAVSCDVNRLVDNMHRLLQRLVGSRITFDRPREADSAIVTADPNQLEQVLLNLVVNARDAMPEGGSIRIETKIVTPSGTMTRKHGARPGEYVELSVGDTGCGMDEATLARIFEPFFTTKSVGRGTGMGLATVFGIVKQSGGFVEVRSEPGVGTTFSVFLPQCRQALVTQTIEQPSDTPPGGTETVLVVEHDDAVRALLRRLLEVRGYTVHEAAHGGDALRIIKSGNPALDLVLTNVQTPVVDGITLVREVRRLPNAPKLLLLSGNADPPSDLDLDVSRQFLRKPFTSADLARKVRQAIEADDVRTIKS